jgi:hypothetical protein
MTGATGETTGATGAMTGKTVGVAGLDCSGNRELDDQRPAAGDARDRPDGRAPPGRRRSRRGGPLGYDSAAALEEPGDR